MNTRLQFKAAICVAAACIFMASAGPAYALDWREVAAKAAFGPLAAEAKDFVVIFFMSFTYVIGILTCVFLTPKVLKTFLSGASPVGSLVAGAATSLVGGAVAGGFAAVGAGGVALGGAKALSAASLAAKGASAGSKAAAATKGAAAARGAAANAASGLSRESIRSLGQRASAQVASNNNNSAQGGGASQAAAGGGVVAALQKPPPLPGSPERSYYDKTVEAKTKVAEASQHRAQAKQNKAQAAEKLGAGGKQMGGGAMNVARGGAVVVAAAPGKAGNALGALAAVQIIKPKNVAPPAVEQAETPAPAQKATVSARSSKQQTGGGARGGNADTRSAEERSRDQEYL